jgi:transglutaminase-like putative cysteine protease
MFLSGALALLAIGASQAMAAEAVPNTVTLETNDIKVNADGSSVQTVHAEIRADNDVGAMRLNQVHLSFDSARQDLKIVEAYTRKADGTKIPIDLSAVFVRLPQNNDNSGEITDQRIKVLVFPQMAAGDSAVYTVDFVTRAAVFPGVYTYGMVFQSTTPVLEERDTITAPKSLGLRTETHDVPFSQEERGSDVVYHWTYAVTNPTPAKAASISPMDKLPRYFVSNLKDYAELGRAYGALSTPKVVVTPKVTELADRLTAGEQDKREQVRKIYEWVNSNIRYIGLELGDSTMVPHDVDAILTYGYGDCKDHDLLMRALLKAKGITTQSVLLNALNDYTLTSVPTFFQLDHVITYVPDMNLFLDSTALATPFGVLPYQEYGKPAIYVDANGAKQGTMPVLQPGVAAEYTKTDMHLSAAGILTGKTSATGYGPSQILMRILGLAMQAVSPEKVAAQQLQDRGYRGATGTLHALAPLTRGPSYTITGEFTVGGWEEWLTGTKVSFMPVGLRILGVSGDGPMGTIASLAAGDLGPTPCFSAHQSEDFSLEIPAGTRFAAIPADYSLKNANIAFTSHWTVSGNTVAVHRDFRSTIATPLCTGETRIAAAKALLQIAASYVMPIRIVPANANPALVSENTTRPMVGPLPFGDLPGPAASNVSDVANIEQSWLTAKLASETTSTHHVADNSYGGHLAQGLSFLSASQLPQAWNELTQAIRLKPVGVAMLDGGAANQRKPTLAELDKALKAKPNDVSLREMHADLSLQMRDYDTAAADYNTIVAAHPNDAAVLLKRADIRYHADKYDEAAIDYRRSLRLGAKADEVRPGLCNAEARADELYALAVNHCSEELAHNANAPELLESRGLALFRLGKFAEALKDFDLAAKAKPGDPRYVYERGVAQLKLGNAAGHRDIEAATKLMPNVARKVPGRISLAAR